MMPTRLGRCVRPIVQLSFALAAFAGVLSGIWPAAAQADSDSKIVFSSGGSPNRLFVMNADGSAQTQLTLSGEDFNPCFNADGSKIVFASTRDEANLYTHSWRQNAEIYVMNADGSGQTRLTVNPAYDFLPRWSPDGRKILFSSNRDGHAELYVMNADGSGQTRLTTTAPSVRNQPGDWSPDGTRIVFSSNRADVSQPYGFDLYIMRAGGGKAFRLTNTGAQNTDAAWSPDGSRIAFEARSLQPSQVDIAVINPDGTHFMRLTNAPPANITPAWNPDGSRLAFASMRDGYPDRGCFDIYTISAASIEGPNNIPVRLTTTGFTRGDNFSPSWVRGTVGAASLLVSDSGTLESFGTSNDSFNKTSVGFVIALSRAVDHEVTVSYSTADLSVANAATAGRDYTATRGTVAFAPGETQKIVLVPLQDDTLDEPDEIFALNLSNVVGVPVLDAQGIGTIVDNEDFTAPEVFIAQPLDNSVRTGLLRALGTAVDDDGSGPNAIKSVTVRLSRAASGTTPAGYWDGSAWVSTPTAAIDRPTIRTSTVKNIQWSFDLPTPAQGFVPARYTLRAEATDFSGNKSQPAYSRFTIDRTAPSVTIATPTESGAYSELPQASGQVTDAGGAGTARVSILLYRYANGSTPAGFWNGTTWISTFAPQAYRPASVAGNSWSCALPTRSQGLVAGHYALRAFAFDRAGNKAASSALSFFITDNDAPASGTTAQS